MYIVTFGTTRDREASHERGKEVRVVDAPRYTWHGPRCRGIKGGCTKETHSLTAGYTHCEISHARCAATVAQRWGALH